MIEISKCWIGWATAAAAVKFNEESLKENVNIIISVRVSAWKHKRLNYTIYVTGNVSYSKKEKSLKPKNQVNNNNSEKRGPRNGTRACEWNT